MRGWLRRTRRGQSAAGTGDGLGSDWAARQLESRGITDVEVLAAMRTVPREQFVPDNLAAAAYEDGALPIGHGQTISQPYIVASMTQAMALPAWRDAHDGERPRVLDVGTGSGYQAAVLAQLGADVLSIERDPDLAATARDRLASLGYDVDVVVGDGSAGLPERAPFAAIVVAAATPQVPIPLVEQLLPDGRLVLPIGGRSEQMISVVRPSPNGFSSVPVEPAVFVPLLGEHGFSDR